MVTKGKGESQKTLKICRFQTMDLSSSLVYRSDIEKLSRMESFFDILQ